MKPKPNVSILIQRCAKRRRKSMEKVRRLTDWVVSKAHEMCSDGNQVAERNGEDELAEGTRHLAGTSGAALTMNFQRAFPSRSSEAGQQVLSSSLRIASQASGAATSR
jgi:hypothetical protein